MKKDKNKPYCVFQVSWEVCNKIGGIYTVLSTQAKSLYEIYADNLIYIGPDFGANNNTLFKEDKSIEKSWLKHAKENEQLNIRIGRWDIQGQPVAVLVDHKYFFSLKNSFLFELWDNFKVDSLHANGDYDESVVFGMATGIVIESYCKFHGIEKQPIVAQFHEWTTGSGLLYTKIHSPYIKTLFTTHATTVGRSICFNEKPLYKYFENYHGDQMAQELDIEAKHSIEKKAAQYADCFTTVSDITADECEQLLEKKPDIVTPNGFEDDFIPQGTAYTKEKKEARAVLKNVAENLLGYKLSDNTLYVGTSGRYEYRNKGIDLFLESLKILASNPDFKQDVVAFILVPGWNIGARKDLQQKMKDPHASYKLYRKYITHEIYNKDNDKILNAMRAFHFENEEDQNIKVIFVPSYLNGDDGIFNKKYYDLLIGLDLTIFASYYEPWGYTPLESAAFGIPTITTDLAGFGIWCSKDPVDISNGIAVIHRSDTNYFEVAEKIQDNIIKFAKLKKKEITEIQAKAIAMAKKCSWKDFISYYEKAFQIALSKKE